MGKLCELYGKLALVTEQLERRANPHLFILQEPKIFFTGRQKILFHHVVLLGNLAV